MKTQILVIIALGLLFNLAMAQEEDCTSDGCHGDLLKKSVVHPAIEEDCTTCHESNGKLHPDSAGAEFTLTGEIPDLCYDCHDQKDNLTVVHEPVKDGACLDCHSPHSSNKSALLLGEEDEPICATCHDLESARTIHPPYEDGDCTACHNPHQTIRPKLLKAERPELCFECHDDKREQLDMESVHPAFEGDCLDCHAPHVSKAKNLLVKKTPNLCFECHDVEETAENPKHKVHGPLKESMPCVSCHNPHATPNEYVLKDEQLNLCLSCHNPKKPNVPDIAGKINKAESVHPPIEDDGCLVCHNVHSEDHPFLLTANFPATAYAEGNEDNFALCFECHDISLIEPGNRDTGFRNKGTNLHAVHVNQEKGRSCVLCHDVHAAPSEHLIADKVRFGQWQMPIRYKAQSNGGSCAPGCHEERTYER